VEGGSRPGWRARAGPESRNPASGSRARARESALRERRPRPELALSGDVRSTSPNLQEGRNHAPFFWSSVSELQSPTNERSDAWRGALARSRRAMGVDKHGVGGTNFFIPLVRRPPSGPLRGVRALLAPRSRHDINRQTPATSARSRSPCKLVTATQTNPDLLADRARNLPTNQVTGGLQSRHSVSGGSSRGLDD